MESVAVLIVVTILLLSPFLGFGWLYGATLIKRLLEKEWVKGKGLLSGYERLSPEERMNLETKRIVGVVSERAKEDKTAWLNTPTPKEADMRAVEAGMRAGLHVEETPRGKWEEEKVPTPPPPVSTLP